VLKQKKLPDSKCQKEMWMKTPPHPTLMHFVPYRTKITEEYSKLYHKVKLKLKWFLCAKCLSGYWNRLNLVKWEVV